MNKRKSGVGIKAILAISALFFLVGIAGVIAWANSQKDEQGGQASQTAATVSEQFMPGKYKVVEVIDGDTIRISYNGSTEKVRIIGIDTPETKDSRVDVECWGPEATKYLVEKISGKEVSLSRDPTQDDYDSYGRMLRYVYLDGADVGLELVRNGYGSEYTYSEPYLKQREYKAAEEHAKANKLGKWSDKCNAESEPTQQLVPEEPKKNCDIKGNINKKGEKIYHMPGQKYYDETQINESKGERWFCSEEEAKAAGWRKSKV